MESLDMMDFLILDDLTSDEDQEEQRRRQEEEGIDPEDYVKDDFDDFDDL